MKTKTNFLVSGNSWSRTLRIGVLAFLFSACGSGGNGNYVSQDDSVIHISVDESFKPIIDSQIQVYESSNPDIRIIAHYKSEQNCMKDMLVDSIRMVIVTRGLSEKEAAFYRDTIGHSIAWERLAYDAMAIIVNNEAPDSLFTFEEIRSILRGDDDRFQPVFDGLQATSNVRFAIDSVLRGEKLTDKAIAAKSSEELIDFVARNKKAMGFIGVSWVGNRADSRLLSFDENVKVAAVQTLKPDDLGFVKPYQANIATKRYPLVRSLYYIAKENYIGPARKFANFMGAERGQLIFRRAYLWPAKMDFTIRKANAPE